MIIKVKLSRLLHTMKTSGERFLCHAVVNYYGGVGVEWDTYFISEESFIASIQKIVGEKYSSEHPHGLIDHWLVNLPSHLRKVKDRPILRNEFRVKLLNWMINKFGDQEIQVVIVERSKLIG